MYFKKVIQVSLILCCFFSSVYATAVYQKSDGEGGVIYSQDKTGDAKLIKLQKVQVYRSPVKKNESKDSVNSKENSLSTDLKQTVQIPVYTLFQVQSPKELSTIWNNAGNVPVAFSVSPGLYKTDSIRVFVDGQPVATMKGLSVKLQHIDRGEHTIYGEIIRDSAPIIATQHVTFHLKRRSIVQPKK